MNTLLKNYWSIVLFTVVSFLIGAAVNILLELLFGVAHISSVYIAYLQYVILMIVYIYINQKWIHQKIFIRSSVPIKEQILPLIFVIVYTFYLLATNNGFQSVSHSEIAEGIGFSLGSAVMEEYIFRGIILIALLTLLKDKGVQGVLLAILISSILFALLHGVTAVLDHSGWYEIFYAFSGGLLFATLYISTGSLLWPMMSHLIEDLVSFLLPNSIISIPIFIYCLICIVISLILLIPYFRRKNIDFLFD